MPPDDDTPPEADRRRGAGDGDVPAGAGDEAGTGADDLGDPTDGDPTATAGATAVGSTGAPDGGDGSDADTDTAGGSATARGTARSRRRARARARRDRAARWRAKWLPRLRVAVFALGGALVAVALAGRVTAQVGPFDTVLGARPSWSGETVLRLAPLGTIQLDTHDWPLRLDLRVEELGLDEATRIAENPELVDTLGDDVAEQVRAALVRLAVRCSLLALAGGFVGALIARLSWRSAVAGLTAGAVVVTGAGAGTAATFDAEAVAEPRYTGLLTVAPQAVGDVQSIVERFGEYRTQLGDLVGNIATLYLAAENLSTFEPADDSIRVMHVSDIHLNPTAFDVMGELVDQFDVDAIADTGDLTDWGTAAEELVVEEIGNFEVPYVYVRGNHDSRSIQEAVAAQSNAVVLDGQAAEVAGLRMWGIGDPRYTPDKEEAADTDAERRRVERFAPEAARSLDRAEPPEMDVALVHDPRAAEEMGGAVPLVLAGHTHEFAEEHVGEETLLLTQGSTGGAGLRGLQEEDPEPLSASVLYFDPDTHALVAYDHISVEGIGETGATIERRRIPADDRQPAGTDDTTATSATTTTTAG